MKPLHTALILLASGCSLMMAQGDPFDGISPNPNSGIYILQTGSIPDSCNSPNQNENGTEICSVNVPVSCPANYTQQFSVAIYHGTCRPGDAWNLSGWWYVFATLQLTSPPSYQIEAKCNAGSEGNIAPSDGASNYAYGIQGIYTITCIPSNGSSSVNVPYSLSGPLSSSSQTQAPAPAPAQPTPPPPAPITSSSTQQQLYDNAQQQYLQQIAGGIFSNTPYQPPPVVQPTIPTTPTSAPYFDPWVSYSNPDQGPIP